MSLRARFRDRLEEARRVHLDPRALAAHLLAVPGQVELTRQLFEGLREGDVTGQTSALSLYQLLVDAYRQGEDGAAGDAADYLTAFRGLEIVPVSAAVARQAAEVRARLGGRSERAVQIATALDARADLYLTRDSGLRRIAGMEVLDLTDFVEA